MILGIFLWSRLGAKDTTANFAVYPYYDKTSIVIGETYRDGKFYDVVETTTVTSHLRVKQSLGKNRYELKLNLDK